MRVLVFGKTGQLALALQGEADVIALGRDLVDLTGLDACSAAIDTYRPDAVINAAAYTAVDRAEDEAELAGVINRDAPIAMAKRAADLDIPFVHVTTDYVFDGSGTTPKTPDDACGPLQVYGKTKRDGEIGVLAAGGRPAILRTSWVFSADGANFVTNMLRLSERLDELNIVADQIGGPTSAKAIATACLALADGLAKDAGRRGIYHFSGAPDVSWADFARAIFQKAGRSVAITDIPTSEYKTPATRPLNSRLDCSKIEETFGIERPDWRADLDDVLAQLVNGKC